MTRKTAPLIAALVLAAAPAFAQQAEIGKPAPAFSLADESGKRHTLAQHKGSVVVLEWTNPECPYVVRHYKADTMETLSREYGAKKVVWLAVDSTAHNTPEKSAAWKKAQGFTYPVLQDPSGEVGRRYGAKTTPHMYVIDAEGVLRFMGGIDDDPRGKSEKPQNHVRASLDAVLAGKAVPASTTQPYGCSVKYAKVE